MTYLLVGMLIGMIIGLAVGSLGIAVQVSEDGNPPSQQGNQFRKII